ncbi:hypothetical protein KJ359_003941 [Pestalotiopsis sp. 9143b]|nr:hypothetical protein KJ359_003941 [Pestalotiopsis sp. 9143b]
MAFLRRMEYFQGLLFLTTNRVGQIDDAFISRVHIAIGYGALSPESRAKIWQGFFRKLAKERAGRIQITPKAKQWVLDKAASGEAQLNGRDIRNALQTAITLAEAEYNEDEDFDPDKTTVVVDQSHFARVLDITNKFHSYVQSIRREDERKRAAGRMDRNDYWINQELQRGISPPLTRSAPTTSKIEYSEHDVETTSDSVLRSQGDIFRGTPTTGFEAKSPQERLAWLRRHGHPSDDTLNLRDYYNRGVSITQGVDLAVKLHVMVGPVVEKMDDATIMRSFQTFILALDNGLVCLDKDISSHVSELYTTGRLSDDSMVLTPVADPKIPDLCDDKPSLMLQRRAASERMYYNTAMSMSNRERKRRPAIGSLGSENRTMVQ